MKPLTARQLRAYLLGCTSLSLSEITPAWDAYVTALYAAMREESRL